MRALADYLPGPSSSLLDLFGLTWGELLAAALLLSAIHVFCVRYGCQLAGTLASLRRAISAVLLMVVLATPLLMIGAALGGGLSDPQRWLVIHLSLAVAGTVAIKLLFESTFPRALLAHLAAGTFTGVVAGALLVAVSAVL